MSWLRFFRRNRNDAELRQQIDLHLAEQTEENLARGMSLEEARRQACLKLGNPMRVREDLWQQNTLTVIDSLWRDLKFGWRSLRRSPGFSVMAVLIMGLGIGVNAALFTVVRSVLL